MANDQGGGLYNALASEACISNRVIDEIGVGETACLTRAVMQEDIQLLSVTLGDISPAHLDPVYVETDLRHHLIAHGTLGGGLISLVVNTKLPGPGTIYLGPHIRFRRRWRSAIR
jgi:acyl dehydratase